MNCLNIILRHTRRASTEGYIASLRVWHRLLNRLEDYGLLNYFQGQSRSKSLEENAIIFVNEVNEMIQSSIKKHAHIKFLDVCTNCPEFNISQELSKFLNLQDLHINRLLFGKYNGDHFSYSNNSCSLADYSTFISDTLLSSTFFDSQTCKVQSSNDIKENGICKTFKYYSPQDAVILLNGSTIHAVGDSITRRLFEHLNQYLQGKSFNDTAVHKALNLTVEMNSTMINIYFYWTPTIVDKIKFMENLVSESRNVSHHFIHIGGPDHDLAYEHSNPKSFYDRIDLFNDTIYKLNGLAAYITMDGVLQFDDSKKRKKYNNYEIVAANGFYSSLYNKQSYFGYIDMWNWILLESRKHCMGRDYTGIHFTNDDVRLLRLQAFLNYVQFFKDASQMLALR